MTPLEQSMADFCKRHSLTSFNFGYRADAVTEAYRFLAYCHFDDARPGQRGCASGSGLTVEAALGAAIVEAHARRHPFGSAGIVDALPIAEVE